MTSRAALSGWRRAAALDYTPRRRVCKSAPFPRLSPFAQPSTEHLVQDASAGDPIALEELLARVLPELHAFLRLQVGPKIGVRESASDLAQSVCREVLADLPDIEFRGVPAFRRWLFLRARRKVVEKLRFHGRERRDIDREEPLAIDDAFAAGAVDLLTPSRDVMAREDLARFARCVEQLPEEQRRAVSLCKGLGMTPSEAAAELDKEPNAVRVALHRGLARLSVLLDADQKT